MGGTLQDPPLDHEADGLWLVELRHDVPKAGSCVARERSFKYTEQIM